MDASAIRAEIQAIDKTLAELQEQLERGYLEFGPYSRLKTDWERKKAALESKLKALPPSPEDIEFVNREDELHLLKLERLRASRSPYTLINAPAGYGKSCLLQHLVHISQADETTRDKWCFRYVDFGQGAESQIAQVVQVVAGRPLQDGPDAAMSLVCNAVVQELTAPSPEGRRALLLIFDAVKRLDQEGQQWLYQLLHELRTRSHLGSQEIITVRVIIAGQAVERFWEGYEQAYPAPPAPQRINLGLFDKNPIQELIWNQARAVQIPLDNPTVAQIADEIEYLSGGHPTVIRRLVDDLSSQSFAIGPAGEYYRRHRGRLVRTHLLPVADDLLRGFDDEIRLAVQALSALRRVNANTVQALIRANALPPGINGVDLLGNLSALHVLDRPSIKEPFYRDRLMRRILALDMAHRSQQSHAHYQRLNQVALELYQDWILGQALPDSYLKATQRLLSVVEWLFHALQDEGTDDDGLRLGLQEHIRILSEDGQPSSVADLIAAEIKQDAEVCYLSRHRLGDDGVSIVCNWLQVL